MVIVGVGWSYKPGAAGDYSIHLLLSEVGK